MLTVVSNPDHDLDHATVDAAARAPMNPRRWRRSSELIHYSLPTMTANPDRAALDDSAVEAANGGWNRTPMEHALKKTKVVATLGPASQDAATVGEMIRAGLNVVRLNLAHGNRDTHRRTYQTVREVAQELHAPLAVMADAPGEGIRTGTLQAEHVALKTGQTFTLTTESIIGDETRVYVDRRDFPDYVEPGMEILLAGGEILLAVQEVTGSDIVCEVQNDGVLDERKRISVPDADIPMAAHDDENIGFAVDLNVDWLAVSFVERAQDIERVREVLGDAPIDVMAKIETPKAFHHIDEIIDAADGIMVARGDLGVELPYEEVPLAQKQIVTKCNYAGKPVIIATQMLKSMTGAPTPTRAEVADVANAIMDGTDAIMLSEETAIGDYPVDAIEVMRTIAQRIEQDDEVYHRLKGGQTSVTEAIGESACEIAERIGAAAIIPSTASGSTARLVAKFRPRTPIVVVTYSERVRNQLALVWGVYALVVGYQDDTEMMLRRAIDTAAEHFELPTDAPVVLTAGAPFGVPGTTNLIKVDTV